MRAWAGPVTDESGASTAMAFQSVTTFPRLSPGTMQSAPTSAAVRTSDLRSAALPATEGDSRRSIVYTVASAFGEVHQCSAKCFWSKINRHEVRSASFYDAVILS